MDFLTLWPCLSVQSSLMNLPFQFAFLDFAPQRNTLADLNSVRIHIATGSNVIKKRDECGSRQIGSTTLNVQVSIKSKPILYLIQM